MQVTAYAGMYSVKRESQIAIVAEHHTSAHLSCGRVQIQAQGSDDLEHGGKFGIAVEGEGFVEALSAEAGRSGDLGQRGE